MKRLLAILALCAAGSSGSVALAADKPSPDDRISDQVRMRLAVDQDVKGGALDVTVKDGVVTLKGRVDTPKGKERASKIAKKVHGVKQVDNELQVGPPTE